MKKIEIVRKLQIAGEMIQNGYCLSMAIDSVGLNPLKAKAYCFLNQKDISKGFYLNYKTYHVQTLIRDKN